MKFTVNTLQANVEHRDGAPFRFAGADLENVIESIITLVQYGCQVKSYNIVTIKEIVF